MSKNLFGEEQAEKEVQDLIRAVLAPYAKVWNITTGVFKVKEGPVTRWIRTFPKGTPDLIGFRYSDQKIFFIEVKKENGVLSSEQKEFRQWALEKNLIYGVARSPADAQLILSERWISDWDFKPFEKR